METYLPYYHRSPNQFLRHEERRFEDRSGHTGTVIIAIYKDKNGNIKEETACVRWDK
jgi:hypothetical protein